MNNLWKREEGKKDHQLSEPKVEGRTEWGGLAGEAK